MSSIAISAGRATAGRQAAEGFACALLPFRRRVGDEGPWVGPRGTIPAQTEEQKALGQIDNAIFPTRLARMSTPLRRWLSPSSARKRRPKPINAASVTAI
jgi:hypothetical protein